MAEMTTSVQFLPLLHGKVGLWCIGALITHVCSAYAVISLVGGDGYQATQFMGIKGLLPAAVLSQDISAISQGIDGR